MTVAFLPADCEKRAVKAEICVPALASERGDSIIITFNAEKVGGRRLIRAQCYCFTFLE